MGYEELITCQSSFIKQAHTIEVEYLFSFLFTGHPIMQIKARSSPADGEGGGEEEEEEMMKKEE